MKTIKKEKKFTIPCLASQRVIVGHYPLLFFSLHVLQQRALCCSDVMNICF